MLLRKMLRDMKAGRVQFISIFLMALLGVFVYAGIHAEWYGMQKEIGSYYAATNFPDLWAMGENFSAADSAKAAAIPGIEAVQRRLTLDAVAKLPGSPVVRVSITDENRLSQPYAVEGEAFDLLRDGIWLDSSFARAHGLAVGDSLTLSAYGMEVAKPILGLILHPEYVYAVKDDSVFTPDPVSFGFAFLPRQAVPVAGLLPYTELMVLLAPGANIQVVKAALADQLHAGVVLTRDTQLSAMQFENEISQNKAMGGVFPVVFFLIAALTMLTTMTRLMTAQRIQIGTLKALGFKRRKILAHYLSYGLWLGLAGGLAGLALGPAILPAILYAMQKAIYALPLWRPALSPWDGLSVIQAAAVCGASSFLACRRELGETPASALRPRVPKASRHTRLEKSRLWRGLGFSTQWNLRDILRSRVRSAMAVAGVMGCVALSLMALALNDSVSAVAGQLYGRLYTYQTRISLKDDITADQSSALAKEYPGQWVQESAVELQNGGREKSGVLTVVSPGDMCHFLDEKGREISLPEAGAALSAKMARLLGLKAGDTLRWRVYGETGWHESVISMLYVTPVGQGIALSQTAYEAMGQAMHPTAFLTGGDAAGASGLSGVKAVQGRQALMDSFRSILDSIQAVIAILILAAVILGVVVLYNLGTLSFTERTRELATLKVLGFPRRKIRALLQKQNIWLTLAGILPGIPAGCLLAWFMLSTISDSSDFRLYISPLSLLFSIGLTFAVSLMVNLLLMRRIRSIDMVSSLKSVE